MGGILASLTFMTQTAFLNTNMVGKGMLDWPAVSEPSDLQGLSREVKEALMTYAGDLYSWYADLSTPTCISARNVTGRTLVPFT